MQVGARSWRAATAAIAVMTLLSGCGGGGVTPSPTATPTPSPTPEPTAAPTAAPGLFVDAGADLGGISPYVYGTNDGPWLGVPFALRDQVVAAKLKFISWPGGNWGDENDVTTDQVDAFVTYCRSIGAEPRIVVRLQSGTASAAADLVRYANVTMKYNVKYWGIGNEPDLYEANGLTGYNVERYNSDWRSFAQAMKAVDPTIELIGPDISQFVASPSSDYLQTRTDWLTSFLKVNGDLVDVVSIHRYPFPADGQTPPTIDDLRGNSNEWDQIIPALRSIVKTQTGKDLPVAVTEVNSSYTQNSGGDAGMDSHYNAIWFADILGRMIDQKVDIVAQFAIAGYWGIVGASAPNPMYYDYMLYKQFGTKLVPAASDDPLVTVYAAVRADGTLTVLIVNLGSTAATKPLTIVGNVAKSAETWLFDASHNAEKVAATPLSNGGNVTLPPESVTLLVAAK
jgi:hypothetical protein